jgi:hypothetical protein
MNAQGDYCAMVGS